MQIQYGSCVIQALQPTAFQCVVITAVRLKPPAQSLVLSDVS